MFVTVNFTSCRAFVSSLEGLLNSLGGVCLQNLWLLSGTLFLTACGGGGGGSAASPVVTNTAPTITDPEHCRLKVVRRLRHLLPVIPRTTVFRSLLPRATTKTFSITTAGALSFATAPDFEAPGDSDTDNVYDVTVQVSDGSLTDTQDLTITVTDAFEGRVVDALIAGATVFVDLNGDNEQDAMSRLVTDDSGFFNVDTFTVPEGSSAGISRGGTDTKTGVGLPDLALISDVPADITKPANVTPLTTVVASVDTPEEKAQVLQAMGIDKTPEELLTTDNWAAAEAGDETAKAAQRVNQQVGLLQTQRRLPMTVMSRRTYRYSGEAGCDRISGRGIRRRY